MAFDFLARLVGHRNPSADKRADSTFGDEMFRLMIEAVQDYAIFRLDPEGRVTTWNPGAERIKGYRADEIIGRHFSAFYPQEAVDRGRPQQELQAARAEGRFEDEGLRVRKDGTQFWANVVITPLHGLDGQVTGFVKITRDLTERRQAEERAQQLAREETTRKTAEEYLRLVEQQREQLRVTLRSIGDAVITTDAEGQVTLMNQVAQHLTGWSESEAVGQKLTTVFHIVNEETRQHVENPALRAIRDGVIQGLANHTVLIGRNGHVEHAIDDSAAPIRFSDGRMIGAVLVFRDITGRRQMEAAMAQQTAKLQEADRRKDEFLAMLAHELRNPLAPMRSAMAVMRLADDNQTLVAQMRDIMERQLAQTVRLVDDLLDVNRITRGKIELRHELLEVRSVVDSAVETSRPLIEAGQHQFTVEIPEEPMYVRGDPTRLAQIVANLLNNSAKYAPANGEIELAVERDGDRVVIRVRDNGMGIPAEMLTKIFDLFTQVDRRLERTQGGLGVGLTLVQRLVEMHHGSIEAHSAGHNRGSEFVVRLPLASPPNEQPVEHTGAIQTGSGQRILIVDDNVDAATTLARMLSMLGYETRTAHTGPAALEVGAEFRPTFILLDIGMPGMNGFETCRAMREQPWGRHAIIAALTGWGRDDDRQRSQEAGFDEHLVKPVDTTAIEHLLAGQRNGQ